MFDLTFLSILKTWQGHTCLSRFPCKSSEWGTQGRKGSRAPKDPEKILLAGLQDTRFKDRREVLPLALVSLPWSMSAWPLILIEAISVQF